MPAQPHMDYKALILYGIIPVLMGCSYPDKRAAEMHIADRKEPSESRPVARLKDAEAIDIAKSLVSRHRFDLNQYHNPKAYYNQGTILLNWMVVFENTNQIPDADVLIMVEDKTGKAHFIAPFSANEQATEPGGTR